jgi:flagellar hook-associated protein 3 FlgL
MSRVTENSSLHAINFSVGKTKSRLERLQIEGSNLKRIQRPSDDPVGSIKLLSIRSQEIDSKQYIRNANYAKTVLDYTEQAVSDLTDIVAKAKEIAIGQSSDLFNGDVRKSVAKEVHQLRTQAISISNKRLGNKYIFSGYKSTTKPFSLDGKYHGDEGKVNIEVAQDFFIPSNFNGQEVFFHSADKSIKTLDNTDKLLQRPLNQPQNGEQPAIKDEVLPSRALASESGPQPVMGQESITTMFDDLESLENALKTDNPEVIQNLLESFDKSMDRLITLRTEIGSLSNSIDNAQNSIDNDTLLNQAYKSKIEDADIAELFSDISKQQNVLKATYKSSSKLLNQSLLDFIR